MVSICFNKVVERDWWTSIGNLCIQISVCPALSIKTQIYHCFNPVTVPRPLRLLIDFGKMYIPYGYHMLYVLHGAV